MNSLSISALQVFWLLSLLYAGGSVAEISLPNDSQQPEIQVLIDVSGSMKQNDPDNLRVDAARLLIKLLPEKAKVGLYLFADQTTILSQTAASDDTWKREAINATNKINSHGNYTDIEHAIQNRVSQAFNGSGAKNLIILTDGRVDISKDIMLSAESRERIFSDWIPKLQEKQIKVLTIALSEQADKPLLDELAISTKGWRINAQSAEELERAFLKLALKVAPQDNLPLIDNQFQVDNDVKEFSVLAFKKPHSAASYLLDPDQKKIDRQTASAQVSWLESANYDLITVHQPAVGHWQLFADVDPDNQVLILTDLKLQNTELTSFFNETEPVILKLYFTDQDKLITRQDFLQLVSLTVSLDEQAANSIPASSQTSAYFEQTLTGLATGKHHIKILADAKTFKRELNIEFDILTSPIKVEKQLDIAKREAQLTFIPDLAVLNPNSIVIEALITKPGQATETHQITGVNNSWNLSLSDLPENQETIINFNVQAQDKLGKPYSVSMQPVNLDTRQALQEMSASEQAPKPESEQEMSKTTPPVIEETPPAETPVAESINWALIGGIVVLVNLLLLGGGYLIYLMIKNKNIASQQRILEKLS